MSKQILAKPHLLLIDDERDILRIVQSGLEQNGFIVDVIQDPVSALNVELDNYDLLVIDIRMPKIDGFELYTKLKDKIKKNKTKICFFTAFYDYQQYRQRFPDWSGECYLRKPMKISDLTASINKILS